ncbi:MAG: hypothetical protein IT359_11470 [Gemmatimonadaceae bacterium]|nr:hypothetical protein [Gemmatimonadaceae bacterium]
MTTALSCSPAKERPDIESTVVWLGRVQLEEPPGVLNVGPILSPDPNRGVLVVDARESQVRSYADDGKLLLRLGRSGGGPGEFSGPPLAGARLHDGRLVVSDATGSLHVFDSTGAFVSKHRIATAPVMRLLPFGDVVILATQRRIGGGVMLLHSWRVGSDSLSSSFFPAPSVVRGSPALVASSGWANADVRGDTIFATFSMCDTLYLFSKDGRHLGKRPLNLPYFKYHRTDPPTSASSPAELNAWMGDASRVERPYVAQHGTLLVQYFRLGKPGPTWMLGIRSAANSVILDAEGTPQLLGVRGDGALLFADTTGSPSSWRIANLERR